MGLFSVLRSIYDVDTLDTRFTNPSSVPYQTVVDARNGESATAGLVADTPAAARARSQAQPSKWRTPEFFFYYAVFIVAVPYMFWIAYDVSRREWRACRAF